MLKQWILAIFSFCFATLVFAQEANPSYQQLPASVKQQAVVQTFLNQDPGKIQVTEFFSFKCPGCYSFEGPFEAWAKKQPQDVSVRRVPVAFGPAWVPLAKTYYVLEELNAVERLTPIIFDAVHKQGKKLETQSEIAVFLSQHGITLDDFNKSYEGFNVNRLWTQAQLLTQAEQVTSIPAVVVNGEYLTHLGMSKNTLVTLETVDSLIAKSRKPQ